MLKKEKEKHETLCGGVKKNGGGFCVFLACAGF